MLLHSLVVSCSACAASELLDDPSLWLIAVQLAAEAQNAAFSQDVPNLARTKRCEDHSR